ncbi:MAG TPA: MEDS domain-containing protein [bacterium]
MRTVAELKLGEHVCCLYESEDEHRRVLSAFLTQGLCQRGRFVYVTDGHPPETILKYLTGAGQDPEPDLASGQLRFLRKEDAYLRLGLFDPDKMIRMLGDETARAVADGYAGLWVTGEMTWALSGAPGSARLIEYEARLNRFFPGSRCVGVCQYDRGRFPASTLLNVLRTHPLAVVGTELFSNFYYVPVDELMSLRYAEAALDNWLRHLTHLHPPEEPNGASHHDAGDDDELAEREAEILSLKREDNTLLRSQGRAPKFYI